MNDMLNNQSQCSSAILASKHQVPTPPPPDHPEFLLTSKHGTLQGHRSDAVVGDVDDEYYQVENQKPGHNDSDERRERVGNNKSHRSIAKRKIQAKMAKASQKRNRT